MKQSRLIILKIVLCCHFIQLVSSFGKVTPECTTVNCAVNNNKLSGWEGSNITLKYTVELDQAIPQFEYGLEYDGTRVIKFQDLNVNIRFITVQHPLFQISRNDVVKVGDKITFSFVLFSLNRTIHSGKVFQSKLEWNDAQGQPQVASEDLTIDVYYGPEIISSWNTVSNVVVGSNTITNLTVVGNPEPTVVVKDTNTNVAANLISPGTYRYEVKTDATISSCDSLFTVSVSVNGTSSLDRGTKLNVAFTPDIPQVTSAVFDLNNCLVVKFPSSPSGKCAIEYSIRYDYYNSTWDTAFTPIVSPLNKFTHCFNFNSSINGTVSMKASKDGLSSNFSSPFPVTEIPDPTTAPSTEPPPTEPDTGASTGLNSEAFKWYYILIIVIGGLILIMVVICIILVATGRLRCPCYVKTKPTPEVNGISNPDYEAEFEMKTSVRHLSNAAGLTRPGDREKDDEVKTPDKESDYVDVRTMEKPRDPIPPVGSTDYAELGPGGRAGEKPKVLPSFYAQVNTDDAYYPPLNPDNKSPPIYAISSKVRPQDGNPVAGTNSLRPPSEYEDDDVNPITV